MNQKKIEKGIMEIVDHLNQLNEDNTIPKNLKLKFEKMAEILKNKEEDIGLRINKALNVIEGVSEDANLQPYTRTQVWNIASMLESLQA